MRVRIDYDRCSGHGRCYSLAPEVFDCDEAGYGLVQLADVPDSLREKALSAVNNCPEGAVSVDP